MYTRIPIIPIIQDEGNLLPCKTWSSNDLNAAQPAVRHAAVKALVQFIGHDGRSDHGGKLGVITIIEELVELFPCPGGRRLCSKVIEDQELGGAHLVEAFIQTDAAVGREGSPQVVQKVR